MARNPELEALATAEQEARFVADVWEAPIAEWLGDRTDASITEVLQHVFGIAKEQQSQSAWNRVARIFGAPPGVCQRSTANFAEAPGGREYRYWRIKDSRSK